VAVPSRRIAVAVVAAAVAALQPALLGQAFAASTLSAPTNLAPNSATVPQKDPVLSWSPVSGASGYTVELSKSTDWSDGADMVTLPDGGVTSTDTYTLPQTLVHGGYFWRVRATNSAAKGDWSANDQLYKAWDDAPSTSGSTPSSDTTATQTGIASYPWRFAWTPLQDASSYEIELSTESTFPQPGTTQTGKTSEAASTVDCLTDATSFTPYNSTGSTKDQNVDDCDLSAFNPDSVLVYWRVRGIDDSKSAAVTEASETESLECFGAPRDTGPAGSQITSTTTTDALGTPTSTGQECSDWSVTRTVAPPTSGAAGAVPGVVTGLKVGCPGTAPTYSCTSMPEISWQPTAGAILYAVTIADDPSFTNVERTYTTPYQSLTSRDQLADNTAGNGYYLAVQACVDTPGTGTAGGCGTASEATFTEQTPAVSGLSAATVPGGERLTWDDLLGEYSARTIGSPVTEAEDYEVQVTKADDTNFDSPVLTKTVDATCNRQVSTCYNPAGSAVAPGTDQTVVSPSASGSYIWRVLPVDLSGNFLPQAVDTNAFTIDVTSPQFSISTKNGVAVTGPITIRSTEAVVPNITTANVRIVPAGEGVGSAVAGTIHQGATNKIWVFRPSHPLATGGTYDLEVDSSVVDSNGNSAVVTGNGVRTTTVAKDTSKGWSYSHGWTKHAASGARSRSYKSASAGHSATLQVVGGQAMLYGCKSPSMGKLTVTVGGHSTSVSEHQSFTRCGLELWQKALPKGTQTVKVAVASGKGNIDEVRVS
jgi:hypothetical protein